MFTIFYEGLGGGTRLAMPKTICAPDSSSLKPGSGATEGVLVTTGFAIKYLLINQSFESSMREILLTGRQFLDTISQ